MKHDLNIPNFRHVTPFLVGSLGIFLIHCGAQAISHRKPASRAAEDRAGDQKSSERDSSTSPHAPADDNLGDEVVVDAPNTSGISGTQIAGRFGTAPVETVSVDEAISVGADVLGAYLQVPSTDIYSLTKPVIAEFPPDPEGQRSIRLNVPLSTSFLKDTFDDEHAFETSPQIGVVSVVRKTDNHFAVETFRSNGTLKISEDGSHFIIRIKQPGSYQVVRIRGANLPEKSIPTTQEPRRKK